MKAPSARVISLRGLPLLFADDSGVASSQGVTRTLHPAETLDKPVIEADRPWEGDRVYIYGSVYADPDSGELRLWYMSRRGNDANGKVIVPGLRQGRALKRGDLVLYATSKDGLNWVKPSLGVFPFSGSWDNNIIFDLHSPSVLRDDREKDPAKRYKMLGVLSDSYWTAFSPDGIRWTSLDKPAIKGEDTDTLSYDPVSGEYLAYHKQPTKLRGYERRVVWLSRSRDFQNWTKPKCVFVPDEEDDAWASKPKQRTEVYNLAVYPHAAGFIGLPTMFRVTSEIPKGEVAPGQSAQDGPIDVQLATSVDGESWNRTVPRTNMIPRGVHGGFDAGAILGVSSTAVHWGDKTWVYYTALTTGHGAPIPPKRLTIGRAEWRRNGFVSLDAGASTGRVETLPLRLSSTALVLNVDAGQGRVRTALLEADGRPIPGFSLDESVALNSDTVRGVAQWSSGQQPPTDRPVRVVLELTNARLFSLESPAK